MSNDEITDTGVAISLTVKNGNEALAFYEKAFNAVELFRMPLPDGGVGHAEFLIGETRIYLSESSPEWHAYALEEGATAPCLFSIASEDTDASFKQAVEAGAEPLMEPADQFWGARTAMVKDKEGYRWSFRQMVEEVSPKEMNRRLAELFGGANA